MISKESILIILGSPIAYYTAFARVLGGVEAGVLTSQFFYWYGKGYDPNGWIYKTQEDIESETGLTRRNQETARKKLRALGVLEEKRMGAPSRLFYRLNLDNLFEIINTWSATSTSPQNTQPVVFPSSTHDGGIRHSTMREPAIVECTDPPSYDARTRHRTMRESANQECANPPFKDGGSRQTRMADPAIHTIYTKNTSENTSENTIIISDVHSKTATYNGDDDDFRQSTDSSQKEFLSKQQPITMKIVMQGLAKEIINDMGRGVWTDYEAFVNECTEEALAVLLTWLWLWDITQGTQTSDPITKHDLNQAYHNPFDAVRSIPGKIITHVRRNSAVDLMTEDRERLERCLQERLKTLDAEAEAIPPAE